jgi:hypothetical protein
MFAEAKGADLSSIQLQGAVLGSGHFEGANLWGANLQGAYLKSASLQGADLTEANLQGADLSFANLQGARLEYARLQAADLRNADLQGANLIGARLWRASFITDLGLSDLTWADFATPLSDNEIKDLRAVLETIPNRWSRPVLERLLGSSPGEHQYRLPESSEQQVLVSERDLVNNPIPKEWLIPSPTPSYTSALTALLVDKLASRDPTIAAGIAHRAIMQLVSIDPEHRVLYGTLGCRLLAKAGELALTQGAVYSLCVQLKSQKVECECSNTPEVPRRQTHD